LRPDGVNIPRLGVEAKALATETVTLRDGAEVVIRVLAAPPGGGKGLIALAGRRLSADLPPGLAPGQKLAVTVEAESAERVFLRIVRGTRERGADPLARLAAALASSGDPELLRAALALAGPAGAVPLPGGDEASLEVDPDEGSGPGAAATGRAVVTLHSRELGAIEIGLVLTPAGIAAGVTVEPGQAAALAGQAATDLQEALEQAAGRPATVAVASRRPADPRPSPRLGQEWVDVRA
jgi:hypothetical protein